MPRYIDAEKLDEIVSDLNENHNTGITRYEYKRISAVLWEFPTADVVERKRGKWIDDKGLYQCSCCKHIWSELWWVENCPMERMYKIMRFCPNCGAELERKENYEIQ